MLSEAHRVESIDFLYLVRRLLAQRDEVFRLQPIYEDFVRANGYLVFDLKRRFPKCYTISGAPDVTSSAIDEDAVLRRRRLRILRLDHQ